MGRSGSESPGANDAARYESHSVLDLTKMALRSWWTIVAGICLGLAGAVLALDRIPQKYEATATIWAGGPEVPESRLTTFKAALLRDESMVELVKRTYGLPEHDDALPGLVGSVRDNISLTIDGSQRRGLDALELRYRDTDARRAALTVNTLAELYLARNSAEPEASKPVQLTEKLEAAAVPTVPYSPKPMRVYGVFLALGCLVFSGPVVARGLLRPVISSEAGFGALSELPVLVTIPATTTEQSRRSARRRMAKNVTLSMLSGAILLGALMFAGMG